MCLLEPRWRVDATCIVPPHTHIRTHHLLHNAESKLEAALASRATDGKVQGFSRTMALRRLHWCNSLLAEVMYLVNVYKVRERAW